MLCNLHISFISEAGTISSFRKIKICYLGLGNIHIADSVSSVLA